MSSPSQMSERVRSLRLLSSSIDNNFVKGGGNKDGNAENGRIEQIQNTLLNKVVELRSIEAISSTAIRVTWEIRQEAINSVEGFYVR